MEDSLVKKKNTSIIILIIIILGLVGYICYDKFIKEEKVIPAKEKKQNVEYEDEKVTLTDEEKNQMLKIVKYINEYENYLNDSAKWSIYKNKNITSSEKLEIALHNTEYKDSNSINENDCYTKSISKKIIDSFYNDLWQEQIYKYEDYTLGVPSYKWDEVSQEYKVCLEGGDVYNEQIISYVYDIKIENGMYNVYQSIGLKLFTDAEIDRIIIYNDLSKSKDLLKTNNTDFNIDATNYEQFSKYKIAFEKTSLGFKISSISEI